MGLPIEQTITDLSERNKSLKPPEQDGDYTKDGFMYCGKCHTPRQIEVDFGIEKRVVWTMCKCMAEESERLIAEKEQKRIAELREKAFPSREMRNWTFANDDRKNSRISDAMKRYAERFPEYAKEGKGLLLYGGVGTGKTYLAACIVNEVIQTQRTALMTSFSRILNRIQEVFEQRQEYIDGICSKQLLVIDDLGVERDSQYALEQVYNVIDRRYQSGKPLIVTTNLSLQEIANCRDMDRKRIYDRILAMCHPVEVSGESRRKVAARNDFKAFNAELGL